MRIRTRILLLLALSLSVAGAAPLLISFVVLQRAPYHTWLSYSDALLEEIGVSRDAVRRHVGRNPEILFDRPGDEVIEGTRMSIDDASRRVQERVVRDVVERSRALTAVAIALVATGALSAGWILGRRVLEPIQQMIERARTASGGDPGARLGLGGPNDEVKELADALDAMLDRISRAHGAQRRFAAQVAHELRTPLTTVATEVEMLLASPVDPVLRTRLEAIAGAAHRTERVVAQLLVLSRMETEDLHHESFAFDELVGNVLGRVVENPLWRELRLDFDLKPASVLGDRPLIETLVRNLIDNAGRHNRPAGWVNVAVHPSTDGQHALLEVGNSVSCGGRFSPDEEGAARTGLSIVDAVLDAHGGHLEWQHAADSVVARVQLPSAR